MCLFWRFFCSKLSLDFAVFAIEANDHAALDHPEAYAIDKGGEIFFILDRSSGVEEVIGTAAMVPKKLAKKTASKTYGVTDTIKVYELAKMAVVPSRQGEGLGQMLLKHCIDFAQQRRAKQITLTTNNKLKPALKVYHKLGFKDLLVNPDSRYERGNLAMVLDLHPEND